MFESFGRGLRMIFASIKMGWQEKRLLLPSILTVFSNFFFATLLLLQAKIKLGGSASGVMHTLGEGPHGVGNMLQHGQVGNLVGFTALNGPMDQGGFGALTGAVTSDVAITAFSILCVGWLVNRFLEGVTTALVYSHLTEGSGSGKFSTACEEVLKSLPALVILGLVTLVAKKIASFLRNKRSSGIFGMGFNFLAGIVEIFWTLAGHLILPSIVIEGTSFWGALKRADKIAQGNLLTIGVGEVGVDGICAASTWIVYIAAVSAFGFATFKHIPFNSPIFIMGALVWALAVVLVTAMSVYIRAAFYTCIYVWAIEAEAVEEADRVQVRPPAPLAHALA
jgi:hypothetical protein